MCKFWINMHIEHMKDFLSHKNENHVLKYQMNHLGFNESYDMIPKSYYKIVSFIFLKLHSTKFPFQVHFLNEKVFELKKSFWLKFHKNVSPRVQLTINQRRFSNGLASTRWQAIIWTNDGLDQNYSISIANALEILQPCHKSVILLFSTEFPMLT